MSYSGLAVVAVVMVVAWDLFLLRTRLLTLRVFWISYAILMTFQLLTNAVLTGTRIVRYSGSAIFGSTTPSHSAPPIFGDGRILFAPVEDLGFGFALVVLTLSLWVFLGRVGLQREPTAGPPMRSALPLLAKIGGRGNSIGSSGVRD